MKHNSHSRRQRRARINPARWATYATAGAATALACASSAEGDIHHFDVNESFDARNTSHTFQFGSFGLVPGAALYFLHAAGAMGGRAAFVIGATNSAHTATGQFVGVASNGFTYVGKLSSGLNVSTLPGFLPSNGKLASLASGAGFPNSQWLDAGTGFIAFRFNLGAGREYGWARVRMDEGIPFHPFTVIDYAFADPGESIHTGQVPEPGSLGLLALGGAGLLAWRKKRAKVMATEV
jgi:hypothetical protein